jgi:hypothetical protein
MTTLYGGPIGPDFTDGEQLTATAFNAVKNYWIVDELPEDAEDGDVVFVIGDPVTPETTFNSATGGVESIVENYNGTGQRWKVHVFEVDTSPKTLVVTEGQLPFSTLVVAGGMGVGYFAGKVTKGGEVLTDEVMLFTGEADVTVGAGGYDSNPGQDGAGGPSVFAGLTATTNKTSASVPNEITGAEVQYGGSGNTAGTRGRGSVGVGGSASRGKPGIVVVAYQISETDASVRANLQGDITRMHHQLPEIPAAVEEVSEETIVEDEDQ